MGKNSAKYGKRFGIFFALLLILCFAAGCKAEPYVYKYIEQWCIYTVVSSWWTTLGLLGLTAFDGILLFKSPMGKIVGRIRSVKSWAVKILGITGLAALCLVAAWAYFAEGVALSKSADRSSPPQAGETKNLHELESGTTIYVNIVMENGRTPQDPDVQYKVIGVERLELPKIIIILDYPRYFLRLTFGAGPIKVTVKPLYPDVTVRFADPLVSLGTKTVVQKHDPDLLGSVTAENRDDYSPVFTYRFDEIGEVYNYTIRGVENTLEMKEKFVHLDWCNQWELSYRDVLNHQDRFAKAGEIVDFYFPGERIIFDMDMIQNSESTDRTLLEKLRGAEQYVLSLESVNAGTVLNDEAMTNREISASSLFRQTKCMVKTGPDIVYHCWAGENDLGCYYIVTYDGAMKWEASPEKDPAVVLRLDIG